MNKPPMEKVRKDWQAVVNEHEQSGMGVEEFCAKRGICATSFYARRKQLRLMNKERSGFIQLTAGPVRCGPKNILPVRDVRSGHMSVREAMPVRIQTPNGYSVDVFVELADIFGVLKSV